MKEVITTKPKIYFGHPVNTYNTELENKLIQIISKSFPKFHVENPNQQIHQNKYAEWKIKKGNGMEYYFQEILPTMDAGIFLPFEDGMLGAGVFGEMEFLYNENKKIYEISNRGVISPLNKLDFDRKLSIEKTRERIYG